MANSNIEELLRNVRSIDDNTQYWLVRTMGGDYYEEYVKNGYVAIGYNEITVNDLLHLPTKDKLARKALQAMLADRREKLKNTGYPSAQMLRFSREMKIGDVVIVPSSSSFQVSFGVICSDMYEETKGLHIEGMCPFAKRRKINWYKTSLRHKLAPGLQLMFNSRHIISEVNGYAPAIDNLLNDFYTKGNETYLVLRVRQNETLSADDFTLVGDLMELFNEYSKESNMGLTSEDIKMKMRVQSEGDILAFAQSPEGIAVIGLIIMFIKGGTFTINYGGFHLETKVPSPGETFAKIAHSVNCFLNDSSRRKTVSKLRKKLDNMDIETPNAIIEMMKELGKEEKQENNNKND